MSEPRTDAVIAAAYKECKMSPDHAYGQGDWAGFHECAYGMLENLCRELEREIGELRAEK